MGKAYEYVVELRGQMKLMENAYDEMIRWITYIEGHNQEMMDTIEEDKAIMLNL